VEGDGELEFARGGGDTELSRMISSCDAVKSWVLAFWLFGLLMDSLFLSSASLAFNCVFSFRYPSSSAVSSALAEREGLWSFDLDDDVGGLRAEALDFFPVMASISFSTSCDLLFSSSMYSLACCSTRMADGFSVAMAGMALHRSCRRTFCTCLLFLSSSLWLARFLLWQDTQNQERGVSESSRGEEEKIEENRRFNFNWD